MLSGKRGSLTIVAALCAIVTLLSSPVLSQCVNCGSAQGIEVNGDGTVTVLPVVAGVDVGPGAPEKCDAANLPGSGIVRNLGTSDAPNIKWGTSRITLDSGNVMLDGVIAPGWSWSSSTKTLTAAQGYLYVFNNSSGMLTQATGPSGLFAKTYQYDSTSSDRLTGVTDSLGASWAYGWDSSSPGPTYVINPDGTKKVTYTYKAAGTNGAGQYDRITVYKQSGGNWVEQQRADYSYNSDNKITQVSVTDADDTGNPSMTNIQYHSGTEGERTNPVRRVYNSKLKTDICYEYDTDGIAEDYGGEQTYGYTQVRRRATCSTADSYSVDDNDNDLDQVSRSYYYRSADSKFDYVYKTVQMVSDGSGDLEAYSTVKYQVYGYLGRFSASAPQYDAALRGKPWKVVDAKGNATTYTYSTANGAVTRTDLPLVGSNQYYVQYWYLQGTNFVEKVRDSRGKYTKYTRDSTYPTLVTKVEVSDSENSGYSTVKDISYYSTPSQKQGMVSLISIPGIEGTAAMETTYDYAETIGSATYYRSNPTTETYSWFNGTIYESKSTTTSYFSDERVRWSKDALENQTDYSYDDECKLKDTWLPADSADSGTVGSCTSTTMTDSSKSWLTDQLAGMALQITSGTYIGNTYRISSNTATVITLSDTLPSVTGATYVVRPYNELHYLTCCGLVDEERDGRGNKTYYEHDGAGRVTEMRNDVTGSGSTYPLVKYTHDDLGQKIEARTYKDSSDSTGRPTSYTYDQLGRLVKMVYPYDGGTRLLWDEYYQYDANGNMVAKLVGVVNGSSITSGSVTAYEYDSLNRLTEVEWDYAASTWPVASVSISAADVSYQYDLGSSLKTQMVDSSGTSSYSYDTRGRLSAYTPSLPANYEVDYTYNAAGDKKTVTVKTTGQNGANLYQTAYSYFKNGWLKQTEGLKWLNGDWSDITRADFTYDAAGRRSARQNGLTLNDLQTEYAYNARDEVARIRQWNASKTTEFYGLVYHRDGAANPLAVDYTGSNCPSVYQGATVAYGYDAASRLTSETVGTGNPTTWSYDWVGNRDPGSNTYDAADILNKDNGYKYDLLGNVEYVPSDTASTRTRYHYNDDNLLWKADDVSGGTTTSTTITWDADQQRLELQRGEDTWQFIYDPTTYSPAVLLSIDNSGTATAYFREPGGELLASNSGSNARNYLFDALGSVVMVSDNSGSVIGGLAYGAWGSLAGTTNGALPPYQFVGELGYYAHTSGQGAALSGLLELGVRSYDPTTGRFAQRDPYIDHRQAAYAYADGNPLVSVDPDGEKAKKKKKPKPKPKPKPGNAVISAALTGPCLVAAPAAIAYITSDCGLHWSENCMCNSVNDFREHVDSMIDKDKPIDGQLPACFMRGCLKALMTNMMSMGFCED